MCGGSKFCYWRLVFIWSCCKPTLFASKKNACCSFWRTSLQRSNASVKSFKWWRHILWRFSFCSLYQDFLCMFNKVASSCTVVLIKIAAIPQLFFQFKRNQILQYLQTRLLCVTHSVQLSYWSRMPFPWYWITWILQLFFVCLLRFHSKGPLYFTIC